MDWFPMFVIIFCSIGILACLVYILHQLQKQKMENYAKQRIYEELQKNEDRHIFSYAEKPREHKKTKSGRKHKKGSY